MKSESDEWTTVSPESLRARLEKAENTLKMAGYTDCGGQLWKPPLGPSIAPMLDRVNSITAQLESATKELEFWRSKDGVNAAADTYYMLCLDHGIPEGGSLADYVDGMRAELEKRKRWGRGILVSFAKDVSKKIYSVEYYNDAVDVFEKNACKQVYDMRGGVKAVLDKFLSTVDALAKDGL